MSETGRDAPDACVKKQRSAVFIDRRFQTRYLMLIAGTAGLIIVVLGLMYASVLYEQRELIGINAIASGAGETGEISGEDRGFDNEMAEIVESEDGIRLLVLFLSALVLVGILSWVAIRMTFRVVGPIKAASTMLQAIRRGDDTCIRHFRKGDEFSFLAQDIIDLRDTMRERETEINALLARAVAEMREDSRNSALADEIEGFLAKQSEDFPKGPGEDD